MAITGPATQITSSTNAQFKIWKSLTTSKGIKENNLFFLMGEKLVNEFLENPVEGFKAEYIIHDAKIPQKTSIRKTFLSKDLFKELDVLGTKTPMLILSFKDFEAQNFKNSPQGLELICPLGDPRNLGALARTALGFGVQEMILTKESTHPFLPHAIKASAGAALKMKFSKSTLAINEIPLSSADYALALHGENLIKTKWPKDLRLWVGEEGPGLNLDHAQKKLMKFINIPTNDVESLNAMVSTSLAIWEWKKQN
ncbi:TrmH family RNA methyltransferase [bacterium]|nr:TrmH family RNA methyltransferase [bacterium]